MSGYTKLFNSILASTIWRSSDTTRLVWITLLAMADKDGVCEGSIPGLADLARVSVEDCEQALLELAAPDPYSRTSEHEGRRIEGIDGVGWQLLNHAKYRMKMSEDERREYNRKKQAEWRAKHKEAPPSKPVNKRQTTSMTVIDSQSQSAMSSHTDTDTDTDTDKTHQEGGNGLSKIKPPKPINGSIQADASAWLDAIAPLVGAKSRGSMADAKKWRDTVETVVAEGGDLLPFLDVVKSEKSRTKDTPHFFTPSACLKAYQLTRSRSPVSTNGIDRKSAIRACDQCDDDGYIFENGEPLRCKHK